MLHWAEFRYNSSPHLATKMTPFKALYGRDSPRILKLGRGATPVDSMKLVARLYGPFKVLQKVGMVAYKLELPEHSKLQPVFHVSQLKKVVGSSQVNADLPPMITPDLEWVAEPEEVLCALWAKNL